VDEGQRSADHHGIAGAATLRFVGIALALVAGAIHFALFFADLIPGETTTVPAFAGMGLGFLGCAAILALRRADLYLLVPVYSACSCSRTGPRAANIRSKRSASPRKRLKSGWRS